MNKDKTEIVVVLDRSGSMGSCKAQTVKGLNQFITEQKKLPGSANFTLVQFNHEYEFVHNGVPLNTVGECDMDPSGSTALYDALGRAINETGKRLAAMAECDRPGLVAFVILTDGAENCSSDFNADQIKEMIKHQQEKYSWQFTFLGANQDAFASSAKIGISVASTSNYSADVTDMAFVAATNNYTRMRSAAASGQSVLCSYTPDEVMAMNTTAAQGVISTTTSGQTLGTSTATPTRRKKPMSKSV